MEQTDKERILDKLDDWFSYKMSESLISGLSKLTIAQLEELYGLVSKV